MKVILCVKPPGNTGMLHPTEDRRGGARD